MIAVITTPQLGKLLHHYGSPARLPAEHRHTYQALIKWLNDNSGTLSCTFPGTDDDTMKTHFSLQTSTHRENIKLDSFRQLPGIDGAYEKPMDELPG